ncbi:MAG: serine/threonine protein kinase [Planctomycetota bacterium]|nr:MAG: serine/threonine protein kinase [Planctomycetota bacterium]
MGLFACAALADEGRAEDWPQWRGPDRNAISPEVGLLQQWPEGGPPLVWRADGLGGGYSAPAISAGRIFGMSYRGDQEVVWARSESGGQELWAKPLGPANREGMPQGSEGPGCTPTVDGDRLYVLGARGALACLQAADGEIVWQRNLVDDFGGQPPTWRYNESPLVDGDKLVCTPGGTDALIVALDKNTGEVQWKCKALDAASGGQAAEPRPERRDQTPDRRPEGGPRPDRQSGAPSGGPPSGPTRGDGAPAAIAGTKDPSLFLSEHWGMTAFSLKVPNGKYLARLYFAETFDGITAPGQRVFSFNVEGRQFNDFDIWEKAGGPRRAYVEETPVEITDEEFRIDFTAEVENPAIKAIELIPESASNKDGSPPAEAIRINAGASERFTDSSGQVWQPDQGFEGGSLNPGFGGFAGGSPGFGPGGRGGRGGRGDFTQSNAAYASAIAIDHDGQRQYVQLTARALIGVAAADGQLLWRYDRAANRMGINCSTPLYHDGVLFAASAYGNGGAAVKLTKDAGGAVAAEEVYFSSNMQNHHGGMIVVDDCLYGASGGNEGGFLVCLDFKTGEVLWRDRKAPKGSLAFADGRLYLRSEAGELVLIEPSRQRFIERGRFQQPDRTESPAWTHPVIAGGKLYVRDQDALFCYDVKAK